MKKIFLATVFCSFYLGFLDNSSAEKKSGLEFNGGAVYAITPLDEQGVTERLGFSTGVGFFTCGNVVGDNISFDFAGMFHEKENMFHFGFRQSAGYCRSKEKVSSDVRIFLSVSILSMSVSTNQEVNWNPLVGLIIKLGVIQLQPTFVGLLGSERAYMGLFSFGLDFAFKSWW